MQATRVVAIAIGLAIPSATTGNSQSAVTLHSAGGHAYRLNIAKSHFPAPSNGYALLLVLDGNLYFETAVQVAGELAKDRLIPPTVIVGLTATDPADEANANRLRDFTDRVDRSALPERVRERGLQTGGVIPFTEFVGRDVLPTLRHELNLDPRCSTLFGHSLGGLGVLHMLRTRPDDFAVFAASSPSIWWGGRSALTALQGLSDRQVNRPQLLLTVGSLEQGDAGTSSGDSHLPGQPDFRMIDNARQAASIASAHPRAVVTDFRVIADRTHASVVPDAIRTALLLSAGCRPNNLRKREPAKAGKNEGGGK